MIGLGIIATYTGYVIGQFKWKYPHVCNMADAGEVMMGPIGREVLGIAQMLFLVFIMASHILTFTVALNSITEQATCSIVFGVVGLVVSFICSLPRTLQNMSWLSIVCKDACAFSLDDSTNYFSSIREYLLRRHGHHGCDGDSATWRCRQSDR